MTTRGDLRKIFQKDKFPKRSKEKKRWSKSAKTKNKDDEHLTEDKLRSSYRALSKKARSKTKNKRKRRPDTNDKKFFEESQARVSPEFAAGKVGNGKANK